jgi:hypothetical protein
LPPTPLSPDFDPLITSCDLTALSGFGGSLRPCCPKTAPGFALCSVRIVLRRSSLCTVPVELSEDTSPIPDRSTPQTRKSLESRVCFVRIVLRRSSLGAVPAEPPEGISSIAVCSTRLARKPPRYRAVPLGLIRRPTRASRVGRRGRVRSSEESQQPGHRRPTKIVCRSILSSLCRLGAPFISPVARFDEQRSAATRDHSARKLPDPVRSVRCIVRPSRLRAPFGHSSAAVPTSKPPSSPCGSDASSRRSSS